jgi:hypothetical protein
VALIVGYNIAMTRIALCLLLACGSSKHSVDGGLLGSGATCDLSNDQCAAGLKCCSEPTHMQPPSHDICVTPQMDGTCPQFP